MCYNRYNRTVVWEVKNLEAGTEARLFIFTGEILQAIIKVVNFTNLFLPSDYHAFSRIRVCQGGVVSSVCEKSYWKKGEMLTPTYLCHGTPTLKTEIMIWMPQDMAAGLSNSNTRFWNVPKSPSSVTMWSNFILETDHKLSVLLGKKTKCWHCKSLLLQGEEVRRRQTKVQDSTFPQMFSLYGPFLINKQRENECHSFCNTMLTSMEWSLWHSLLNFNV